jgi:hypothetical protein
MKHRHTFFIHDADPSLSEAFDLVPEKKDKPSELRIRHLPAAREWKVTIDLEDLDPKVHSTRSPVDT